MPSKVFYAPFGDGEPEGAVAEKLRQLFRKAGLGSVVQEGGLAAVKTHFGEAGDDSHVAPPYVKVVVEEVQRAGGKPCLVETSTLYRGQRSNAVEHFHLAAEHGFGPDRMGCPVLFVDGLRGNLHVEEEVGLKHFDTVAVAGDFTLIPSAVIVTHVTGHILAGFGGAIKNVAMGLASRAGKLRQHSAGHPEVKPDACTACGQCARWCPVDAITVEEAAQIDHALCIGCGECLAVCPFDAIGFSWDEGAEAFNEKMGEYAYGILKGKDGRVGFINFLLRTTKQCNCLGEKGKAVCADLGILASTDPVAVDQASIDLLNEAHGGELFEELWPGSHHTVQLEYGERIGLGSRRYELVRI